MIGRKQNTKNRNILIGRENIILIYRFEVLIKEIEVKTEREQVEFFKLGRISLLVFDFGCKWNNDLAFLLQSQIQIHYPIFILDRYE